MRTVPEMKLWEMRYGKIPWKGAWGGLGPIDKASSTQPPLPKLDEGMPGTAPVHRARRPSFLIKQVHAHPHQVTIVAAGPADQHRIGDPPRPDLRRATRRS